MQQHNTKCCLLMSREFEGHSAVWSIGRFFFLRLRGGASSLWFKQTVLQRAQHFEAFCELNMFELHSKFGTTGFHKIYSSRNIIRSQGSSVGIMHTSRLQAVQFLPVARDCSLFHSIWIGYRAQPESFSVGAGGAVARALSLPLISMILWH